MTTKRITTTLTALVLTALLGACSGSDEGDDVASVSQGDSDEQTQPDEGDTEAELLDWTECMRDEGIDIPDPTLGSDGRVVPGDDSGDEGTTNESGGGQAPASREEMEAAEDVCGQAPALGAGDVEDQQAAQDAALEFAQCMRDQGIDDFPDPDLSTTGPGDDDSDDGRTGPFGDVDMDDPETQAAFEACQDLLGGPGGGAGGGPGVAPSGEG